MEMKLSMRRNPMCLSISWKRWIYSMASSASEMSPVTDMTSARSSNACRTVLMRMYINGWVHLSAAVVCSRLMRCSSTFFLACEVRLSYHPELASGDGRRWDQCPERRNSDISAANAATRSIWRSSTLRAITAAAECTDPLTAGSCMRIPCSLLSVSPSKGSPERISSAKGTESGTVIIVSDHIAWMQVVARFSASEGLRTSPHELRNLGMR
ncbi:unnamed protein product [Mycena citricolor]|uniref:Uncharacterized protein n=1 Tax=Mycena citricolor TaxID=2018698 RepID=A0AAD2GXT0_9AGAR|nr:unnamed protein product [Mycena citricolor]